jgi:UV DNA damage endonuclease
MEEEDIELSDKIDKINTIINKHSMRIFIYVGKDYFLGTQIEDVKIKTIALLDSLSILLDSLGIDYPSLIVRIGSAYGNRKKTMKTFCSRLPLLNKNTVKKLTVTNDDKPSLFSITDLLSGIYYECSIPLCFRLLPHHFNNGGLTIREALFLACSTWDIKDKPIFFHSESFEIDEYGISLSPVNADLLTRRIPTFGLDCDVIIDSQLKEIAYMHYIKNHRGFLPMVINKKIKK